MSQPSEFALELLDVRKRFGKSEIIRGAQLQVRPGERVAIIGPNGAGKTTLFKMITGQEPVDGGSITVGDTVDLDAFRKFAQQKYVAKYAAEWPKGALEKINAL